MRASASVGTVWIRHGSPGARRVQNFDQARRRQLDDGSMGATAALLDPAADAHQPARQRLRVDGIGAEQAPIGAAQRG